MHTPPPAGLQSSPQSLPSPSTHARAHTHTHTYLPQPPSSSSSPPPLPQVNIAKGWLLSPSWLLSGGYSRIRQKSAMRSPLPRFPHVAGVVRRCDRRTGQLRRAARRRRGLVVDGGLRGRAREAQRHVVERRRAACPNWGGRPPAQRWSGIALARVTALRCARSGLGIAAAA